MKEKPFKLSVSEATQIDELYEENGQLTQAILIRRLQITSDKANWIVRNIRTLKDLTEATDGQYTGRD